MNIKDFSIPQTGFHWIFIEKDEVKKCLVVVNI
jgi:hypothetical protein